MRVHRREKGKVRDVLIKRGYLRYAEGSALIEIGNTRIICAASVEENVPPWMKGEKRGWITAEYSLLPRATHKRNIRDAARGRIGGRTSEIQRFIGRALRAVIDFQALGERTIWLDCDVLQADGGTRTAAVTGAFVALAEACYHLFMQKKITRFPIKDFVAAISAGIVDDKTLLDLSFAEDRSAQVDMNIVMTGRGELIEIQGTAEKRPFSKDELDQLLALASSGVELLISAQKESLGEIAEKIQPPPKERRLLLASFNEGKIKELRELLAPLPLKVVSLRDFPLLTPVEETGSTFEENAILKAETYSRITGEMVLADDSGLEVEYLQGRPGIYSARFAGEGATDEQNNSLLLKMMENVPPAGRKARFVCVVALAAPGEKTRTAEGISEGSIAEKPRGKSGFGYDPLFFSPEEGKTFAEMDAKTKGRLSHRGKALQNALELLKNILSK
ncbi:MAG TPA: ribonuclease PH [Firmicutes bacterium]|jgi:ribonuclease PH|nr:ribonuclease PH [Bacillota bacterium]